MTVFTWVGDTWVEDIVSGGVMPETGIEVLLPGLCADNDLSDED